MEDRVIRSALMVLATLFMIFLATQIYQNYVKKDKSVLAIGHVMMYTKPGCRYCELAESLLNRTGIIYDSEDISNNLAVQQKLINDTGQYTVPYIFIKGQFIGGYSDLVKMNNDGRLLEIAIQMRDATENE